jgi:hypothetical protein
MTRHASAPARRTRLHMVPACALALAALMLLPTMLAAQAQRTFTASRQLLVLDGNQVVTRGVEGGEAVGELMTVPGPEGVVKKQIRGVRYNDILVEVGADTDLREWIAQSWTGTTRPKNGTIITTDFNYKSVAERQFMNAVITETTIPTLDGAAKDAAFITVKMSPEAVAVRKGSGQDVRTGVAPKQKPWLRSNFRFELAGLPTNRVARIDSFTVRTPMAGGSTEARGLKAAAPVQFPNLRLAISQADYQPWADWAESFITKGDNGDNAEKNGAIVFLEPNMKDEIGRVALANCGILSLAQTPSSPNMEAIPRFTVELYCERMAMEAKP